MSEAFEYNATVHRRMDVTDTLSILQIKSDTPFGPFKAGQFTMVGLKPDAPRCSGSEPEEIKRKSTDPIIRRAYSMSSDPVVTEYYEIYLSWVKKGELTSRLFHLRAGDRLWNSGKPAGLFTLDAVPPQRGLLMLSTGTGIAPFMSMVRQALREKTQRPLILLNAIDVSPQLGFRQELELLAKTHSNFHYLPVVTFPDREPTWKGLTGWVQDDLRKGVYDKVTGCALSPDQFHALLCGNPNMIQAGIEALTQRGFKLGKSKDPAATIYIEEYW